MRPDEELGSIGPAFTEGGVWDTLDPVGEDRYEEGGALGSGGMGVVSVAVDTWLDREVARKRPRVDLPAGTRDRLVREARITARLAHPGIVPVLDYGEDEEGPYYTMPVLEGVTLDAAVREGRPLVRLVRVLAEVARAVAYAHDRGIVHRDLKPANVLLGAFGEVRVLDWGVAFDPREPDAEAVGTPGYRAPEQARGERVGPQADVWSLGRMLAELGPTDRALQAIVEHATAEAPDARYPDADALAEDLERWLDGRRVLAHDYTPRELAVRFLEVWRGPLVAGGIAGAVLVGLMAAWATTNGWERDRALAAEAEMREARALADRSLASALLQTAGARLRADQRASAEVLAGRVLELGFPERARGVLMAWDGMERPELLAMEPRACELLGVHGEAWACADGGELVVSEGWRAPLDDPGFGPVRRVVRDGSTVLLFRRQGALEVWREGARLALHPPRERILEPVRGSPLSIRETESIGRIEADGSIRWSVPLCARSQGGAVDGERIAVACANEVVVGTMDGVLERFATPESTGRVALTPSGVVVGTYEGHLLSAAHGFVPEPSGVGAVLDLVPDGEGVWVVGEEGPPRRFLPRLGAFDAHLPRTGRLSVQGGRVTVVNDSVERWSAPSADPAIFRRGGEGGFAFADLDADGRYLVTGGSTGEARVLDLQDGTSVSLAMGCGNVAKSGTIVDGVAYVTRLGCPGPLGAWRVDGTALEPIHAGWLRSMVRWRGGFAGAVYGDQVLLTPDATLPGRRVDLGVDALATHGDELLLVGDDRVLHVVGDEPEVLFDAPGAGDIAAFGDDLVLALSQAVELRGRDGSVRWRWESEAPITRVGTDGRVVAVGDLEGGISLLDGEGALLASVRGHTRRVVALELSGDTLLSASWDGTVRRWGLGVLERPVEALAREAGAWSLSLESVLAGESGLP